MSANFNDNLSNYKSKYSGVFKPNIDGQLANLQAVGAGIRDEIDYDAAKRKSKRGLMGTQSAKKISPEPTEDQYMFSGMMQSFKIDAEEIKVANLNADGVFELGNVDTRATTIVEDDGTERQASPKEISTGKTDPLIPFKLKIQKLKKDKEFMSELSSLKKEFNGLTDREVFLSGAKESSLNPKAVNNLGYKGFLQMGKDAAADSGINYENYEKLSIGKQLKEFGKYLRFHKFDPSKHTLGLLLAAPSYKDASPNTVVYKKGSEAAKKNPGWVDSESGNVTVASINNFYRGN